MAFDVFQMRVNQLAYTHGLTAVFEHSDDGKHIARISDGTTIMGHSTSSKITVVWGSGHKAMAAL